MQQWYLYIIENRLGQLYTGITCDVERRFQEHQSNSPRCAKALRGKQPLTLRISFECSDKSHALKLEQGVKKLSRDKKLKLINKQLTISELIPELHEVSTPT